MKLASFDIFDTALIRICGSPENIFYLLSKQLFPNNESLQYQFFSWRKNRAVNVCKENGIFHTIEDIYNSQEFEYPKNINADDVKSLEKQVESQNLIANPCVKDKIKDFKENGYSIAFISDMYLDEQFLMEILIREGLYEKDKDYLYVSCVKKAGKHDGSLYELVRTELNPDCWIHHGDNQWVDVYIAKQHGIDAKWVINEYTPYERSLQEYSHVLKNSRDIHVLSGIKRCVRSLMGGESPEVKLSVDFVASLYVPYALHIIKDARRRGIERLYFLSRDGYVLMKIAESIPHEGIEFRYLFASRKSLLEDRLNSAFYFKQEGLLDSSKNAIVDVGWVGNIRKVVNEITEGNCFFYYLGSAKEALTSKYGKFDVYINEWPLQKDSLSMITFVESYCSLCPYPTTLGYYEKDGVWAPRFPEGEKYQMTDRIEKNIRSCVFELVLYNRISYDFDSTLYSLAIITLDRLSEFLKCDDLVPLDGMVDSENQIVWKRFSKIDVMKVIFGNTITLHDFECVKFVMKERYANLIWKIHNFCYRIRQKI